MPSTSNSTVLDSTPESTQVPAPENATGFVDDLEGDPLRQAQSALDGNLQTWDESAGSDNKGGFVSAKAARGSKDKRFFADVANPLSSKLQDALAEETQHYTNLNDGKLQLNQLKQLPLETVKRIDPMSNTPQNILRHALGQSWNVAKKELTSGAAPMQQEANKAIMRKLWEYRKWHHDLVLQQTQGIVNKDVPDGLEDWKAAGSDSLTSDIDVNLKGNATERAVAVFNEEFKRDFSYEAGVVYDVNVYALDFMHGAGESVDGERLPSQEGSREGRKQGGISDNAINMVDAQLQEEWALVKLRLYMNDEEWRAHKESVDPDNERSEVWRATELKYAEYRDELHTQMLELVGPAVERASLASESGFKQIEEQAKHLKGDDEIEGENLAMQAANRIYEKKLMRVETFRGHLSSETAAYKAALAAQDQTSADIHESTINELLITLRELLAECSLYANEAYVTHGGVTHAVVGLQIGKPVVLTNEAMRNAMVENHADALKEIGRHGGSLGEAVYKSGKYVWRFADAIRNMGISIPKIRKLYDVGYEAANTIKSSESITDKNEESEQLANAVLKVSSVAAFKASINEAATAATRAYNDNIAAKNASAQNAAPIQKKKH